MSEEHLVRAKVCFRPFACINFVNSHNGQFTSVTLEDTDEQRGIKTLSKVTEIIS